VGLAISSTWRRALQRWEPVKPCLLWARFAGTINTSVIVAYAPTSTHPAARQTFFDSLNKLVGQISPRDILLVLGDFNSKVGNANSAADNWGGVLGRHGVGQIKPTGWEMLHSCTANRLCIGNTFFRAARKLTFQQPAAASLQRTHKSATAGLDCLDYVLVRRQWLSALQDVWVGRRANPGWAHNDHHPVLAKVWLHMRAPQPCRHQQQQQQQQQEDGRQPRPDRLALSARQENDITRHCLGVLVEAALAGIPLPPMPAQTPAPQRPPTPSGPHPSSDPAPPALTRSYAATLASPFRPTRTLTPLTRRPLTTHPPQQSLSPPQSTPPSPPPARSPPFTARPLPLSQRSSRSPQHQREQLPTLPRYACPHHLQPHRPPSLPPHQPQPSSARVPPPPRVHEPCPATPHHPKSARGSFSQTH
jgi:hypothetical protein